MAACIRRQMAMHTRLYVVLDESPDQVVRPDGGDVRTKYVGDEKAESFDQHPCGLGVLVGRQFHGTRFNSLPNLIPQAVKNQMRMYPRQHLFGFILIDSVNRASRCQTFGLFLLRRGLQ